MNNKVKFLRGTSGEYAVAEKDIDTIYFTTDDGKLYIGNKEISGGGSYELPIATTEILGGVMPDGTTITVDENGVISAVSGGMKVDTLLDITVSKGDTRNGDYSSCSLENNSIITLDGNMLDYKFVYRVADHNGGISFGTTQNRSPCIFDPDDLTHKSYGETGLDLINVSNGVYLYYSSMNQCKIKFASNSSVFTSRIRLLGIK